MDITLYIYISSTIILSLVLIIFYLIRHNRNIRYQFLELEGHSVHLENDSLDTQGNLNSSPTELALIASEKRFETLVDSLKDLLFILDNKLNLVGLYGKGASRFMVNEELDGYSFENLLMVGVIKEANNKALRGQKSNFVWNGELDGEKHQLDITISPIIDTKDKVTGIVGVVEDQTETAKNLENLFQLASIIELAQEMIFLTDSDGKIDYINPAYESKTGYTLGELIGKPLPLQQTHPEEYRSIRETIKSGKSWRGRVSLKEINSKKQYVDLSITPIIDRDNRLINFVGVCRDISDIVNLESEFEHLQRIVTVNTLASGIAHDLNNILSGLSGHFELVSLKNMEGESFGAHMDTIKRSLKKASNLLTPLLGFARPSLMDKSSFDLVKVIEESVALAKRSRRKKIVFNVETCESEIWMYADETQLSQVLLNLFVNAVDASENGQTVNIKCSHTKCKDNSCTEDKLSIVIEDKGTGIEPDVQEKIFEPFFTTKELGEGTGLGLSTVKRVIESNNGTIDVESTPGEGTSFKIILPLRNQKSEETAAENIRPEIEGNGTILLAEYDDVFRTALSELLARRGYEVLEADNCKIVQQLIHEEKDSIDVIVFNLFRPIPAGISTIKEIKLLYPDLPVLITGGNISKEELDEMKSLGVNQFLAKPFTSRILSEKIELIRSEVPQSN